MSSRVVQGDVGRVSSCFQTIGESKKTDALLLISIVALVAIGIMASTGVFNFMGTTHAAYFSYGMYGGAALLVAAEIIKLAIYGFRAAKAIKLDPKQNLDAQVSKIEFSPISQGEDSNKRLSCKITLTDNQTVQAVIDEDAACYLAHTVSTNKCSFTNANRTQITEFKANAFGTYYGVSQAKLESSARQVVVNMSKNPSTIWLEVSDNN